MAVKEALASPTYAERAKTLVFVVRSAIKEGLFDLADEAAEEIPRHKVQDSAKIEIIDARSKALSQLVPSTGDPASTSTVQTGR